jgi:hypothetical protein
MVSRVLIWIISELLVSKSLLGVPSSFIARVGVIVLMGAHDSYTL